MVEILAVAEDKRKGLDSYGAQLTPDEAKGKWPSDRMAPST